MMQIISTTRIGIVLACLLLSCVSGSQRPIRCTNPHNRNSREHRVLARLRRCRGDNPFHHPVRPCKNAILPPDDDSVDPKHSPVIGGHERLPDLGQDPNCRPPSPVFSSRPLPTEVPRHQALCILLI
jgi:hypothetical protein